MTKSDSNIHKQFEDYNAGKQVISLLFNILVSIGITLEMIVYYNEYTVFQYCVQAASIAVLVFCFLRYFKDKQKYYSQNYLWIAYSTILNFIVSDIYFNVYLATEDQSSVLFFSRNLFLMISFIAFVGFIAPVRHIIFLCLLLIGDITYNIFALDNDSITNDAALYYLVSVGFCWVLFFLMNNLNKFLQEIRTSNEEINNLQSINLKKKEQLEKYYLAIIDLSKRNFLAETGLIDIKQVFEQTVYSIYHEVNCSRVSIWLFDEAQETVTKKILYSDGKFDDTPTSLSKTQYPNYFTGLLNLNYVSATEAETHNMTHEFKEIYLKPLHIFSLLDCPIKINNKVVGIICCEHQFEKREWEQEDILFVQSVSDFIALSLKNVEAETLLQSIKAKNAEILETNASMKLAQSKLVVAKEEAEQGSKSKSDFLAIMSHEIRTPLNAVLGFSELLKGKTTDPKYEKYVEGILTGGKDLLSLVNDILDLSKIESGHLSLKNDPLNLVIMLTELGQIFSQKGEEKGLKFAIEFDPANLPNYVLLDELRLRQIIFNLVGNAFKFTHKGGVSLCIEALYPEPGRVNLIFKVSDTGIGIPLDQQSFIFEPFKQQDSQSTRKYGGTGLGLSITKHLVDMFGGEISVDSVPGVGSTFTVILKEVEIPLGENALEAPKQNLIYKFKGQTILLVEDIESNRELVNGYLENSGLSIIMAENGHLALEILKTKKPELILMDMMMPVMDGYTAAKHIRADPKLRHIPILALTASAMKQNEDIILDLCNDYLPKPFSKSDFLKLLSQYLEHSSMIESEMRDADNSEKINSSIQDPVMRELKTKFMPLWEETSELMSIDDVSAFGNKLKSFGLSVDSARIIQYADELLKYAGQYAVLDMTLTFNKFRELIRNN